MKYLIGCLFLASLIACNSKKAAPKHDPEDIAGGPCTYKYDTLPARVIKIRRENNQPPYVEFAIQYGSVTDTTSYFMANGKNITEEEMKTNGVDTGAVFQLINAEIRTGTCNPHVKHIDLEKYAGKMPANGMK